MTGVFAHLTSLAEGESPIPAEKTSMVVKGWIINVYGWEGSGYKVEGEFHFECK